MRSGTKGLPSAICFSVKILEVPTQMDRPSPNASPARSYGAAGANEHETLRGYE